MTDRDRLIELLKNTPSLGVGETADHLLANGVFLLPEDLRGTEDFSISAFIEAMKMYKQKDRYIKTPCKVGDKVYVLAYDEESNWIDEYKVKYFYCSSKGINRIYIECGTMGNNFRPKDIGKTVFLTKEEAEQKLKELKDNANR